MGLPGRGDRRRSDGPAVAPHRVPSPAAADLRPRGPAGRRYVADMDRMRGDSGGTSPASTSGGIAAGGAWTGDRCVSPERSCHHGGPAHRALVNQPAVRSEKTLIDLYDVATSRLLGSITEADLQVLIDALEEE